MRYVKTTVDRYDPGTHRGLPAGFVGRVTGGDTARVAVNNTRYPAFWFVDATFDEWEAWQATGVRTKVDLVIVDGDGVEHPLSENAIINGRVVPVGDRS